MAIDDADGPDSGQMSGDDGATASDDGSGERAEETPAAVGRYTWKDFLTEFATEGVADDLYQGRERAPGGDRWDEEEGAAWKPTDDDWDRIDFDPGAHLGFHPDDLQPRLGVGGGNARNLQSYFESWCDPETSPVRKDRYLWEHYKREYYYDEDDQPPREDGERVPFDRSEELGFDPDLVETALARGGQRADELADLVDERTVDVVEDFDKDAFFTDAGGATTIANRYDLEKAVPMEKKRHFREVERYWANEPYSFVIIFHSTKENEKKYYLVEPYTNPIENDLREFITGKLRTAIKYGDDDVASENQSDRQAVIEEETHALLERYDLFSADEGSAFATRLGERFGIEGDDAGIGGQALRALGWRPAGEESPGPAGIAARPEPAVLAEDSETLTEYQVEKLLYFLERDFIGYELIDGIKHDINVEDISCDGYNSPVFVYHGDYEQIITNVYHGESELDDFVVKLAQRSGKGISKRRPQVDATLPDGSRAQLTLGREVSDHGTNYTIRQFKDVPFTPIDLINWNTFSLEEMAFLWLCIENHKSLIFAGGTASGKTTSLNAVSLFIPSNSKIVSIEDTREVELPQRNWIASVTRPSFSDDEQGDVDEFDLLEAALRQRPDYIVMGEIRGEEGRTLFQVMSTGHTTYTTFHADSVGEVLKRFTTDPINVSKTMFTALDLVSIQTSTRVQGSKVRRNKSLTEINHYDAENDEINVQDVYQWQAETDKFLMMGESNTLEEIKFDRGWSQETLEEELFMRKVVLAYLIENELNTYTQVAATLQAFINDSETILALIANDDLEASLTDLREMESVLIDVDPEKEEMVPRPDPNDEVEALADDLLDRAEEDLFPDHRGTVDGSVAEALANLRPAESVEVAPSDGETEPEPAESEEASELGAGVGTSERDAEEGPLELDDGARATESGGEPPALDGEARGAPSDGEARGAPNDGETADEPALDDPAPSGDAADEAAGDPEQSDEPPRDRPDEPPRNESFDDGADEPAPMYPNDPIGSRPDDEHDILDIGDEPVYIGSDQSGSDADEPEDSEPPTESGGDGAPTDRRGDGPAGEQEGEGATSDDPEIGDDDESSGTDDTDEGSGTDDIDEGSGTDDIDEGSGTDDTDESTETDDTDEGSGTDDTDEGSGTDDTDNGWDFGEFQAGNPEEGDGDDGDRGDDR